MSEALPAPADTFTTQMQEQCPALFHLWSCVQRHGVHHNDVRPYNIGTERLPGGRNGFYLFDFGSASCAAMEVCPPGTWTVLQALFSMIWLRCSC